MSHRSAFAATVLAVVLSACSGDSPEALTPVADTIDPSCVFEAEVRDINQSTDGGLVAVYPDDATNVNVIPVTAESPVLLTEGEGPWAKPAGFDAALQADIESQRFTAGSFGYGGTVPNPFPELPGTDTFSGMQITRTDAIQHGTYFGRPAFRFYVDANSRHSNGLRAEFTGGADFKFRAGDEYRYEFASYFPEGYKFQGWSEWNLFAQFHGPGFPAWGLHTAGGYLHMKAPGAEANEYRVPMPARGQWHEFEWTIRWSKGSDGYATLKIDGSTAFEYRGVTMHASEDFYYPKFGSYLANNPYTQVMYQTPWKITKL